MKVGASNDPAEHEAERTADHVASGKSGAAPAVSRLQRLQRAEPDKQERPAAVQRAEANQKTPEKPTGGIPPAEPEKQTSKKPEAGVQRAEANQKTPEKPPSGTPTAEPEKQTPKKPDTSVQRAEKDEKKPAEAVQRWGECSEERSPQRSSGTASIYRKAKDESQTEEPVRRQSAESMDAAATDAVSKKDKGEPLRPDVRRKLEPGLGADLGDVRVHEGPSAQKSAEAMNARAFTHKNDIWLGRGESQADTRLMAHEAAHVVQQTGSVNRNMVRRTNGAGGAATPPPAAPPAATPPAASAGAKPVPIPGGGWVDARVTPPKMLLPQVVVPEFKAQFVKSSAFLTLTKQARGPQKQVWVDEVGTKAEDAAKVELRKFKGLLPGKGTGAGAAVEEPANPEDPNRILFLQIGKTQNYLIGTPGELAPQFTIPRWDKKGTPRPFDVDHRLELQLGGDPGGGALVGGAPGEKDISNLWLLDASANRSAGSTISNNVKSAINTAVGLLPAGALGPQLAPPTDEKERARWARQHFEITFQTVVPGGNPPNADATWLSGEIQQAKPAKQLEAIPKEEIEKRLLGKSNSLVLYPLATGGRIRRIDWDAKNPSKSLPGGLALPGLTDATLQYKPGGPAFLQGTYRPVRARSDVKPKPISLALNELGGMPYTVVIDKTSLTQSMRYWEFYRFSPMEFEDVTFEEGRGFVLRGKLMPTIPIFRKLDIDVVMDGNDLSLSKTLTAQDFNFPGPIKVPEASLTLSVGGSGVRADGEVLLEIERLGKGKINAGIGSDGGLELTGTFNFDTDLFDPFEAHVKYAQGKLSGGGILGIKAGKVRGIKSASINASIDDGVIDAKGSITPDIPAVEQADLSMHYDEKSGLSIAGDLQLKKDIPGIAGGSVHAEVIKKGEKYAVKASGTATPKIPGISSQLAVSYDDGAFDASVTAGYEKGMLKGSVTVGATNRPVGDDGKPAGPPPEKSDKISFYGEGSVKLRLAPWLEGGARIKFKPNGEVQVTGEIGLPSTIDIFDEKKLEKNLISIKVDIPIFGVSVLGQRIGIFLDVGGGLDLSAGIGPGQLRDVSLSVTYNPDHEEDTTVHGHAALYIPAHAGLRLSVHAAIGGGIPVVSAEAGIELGGTLGVEGAAQAAVDVDWTPKKGLVLDAQAEISAEPKFKFDITGFVLVEADLLLKTITLYEHKWQLAAVEYGSGLKLGMKLPVHYEEGKPFSVSMSDIQFQVPDVNPMETLKGIFHQIVGED